MIEGNWDWGLGSIPNPQSPFLFFYKFLNYLLKNKLFDKLFTEWGQNGDWGLGIGDWGLDPIPNPQSPIPNPQSPITFLVIITFKQIN